MCTEVLSGLCNKALENGPLPGVKVARNCPPINHLLFADDTMFFGKSNTASCATLLSILDRYEKASGQCINRAKSAITFSSKTNQECRTRVKRELNINNEGGIGKYLGLPEHFGRRKRYIFASIVDRIRQRAQSWTNRFLSGAVIFSRSSSDVHGSSEFLSPPDPPDPPDLPDLDFDGFVSSLVRDLPVLQRILCLSGSVTLSSNSITAVCSLIYWSSPAPSNAIRLYFGPSNFSPQVSQICGSLVVGFVIRSDILLGWYYEALVTEIDFLYVLVNVQSFVHLCCLRSSQSFRMFAALFMCGLGSFVTTLKVSNGNSLALEQSLTVIYVQFFVGLCCNSGCVVAIFSPFVAAGKEM
ncbi:hypothetical protein Bca4012_046847 [Brassica carinata]